MAFAGMFIAAVFIVVISIGFGILLVGAILDIIWIIRKALKKKVHVVLKVFAILLTVVGLLVGIGPIVAVAGMAASADMAEKAEIADFAEDDFVYAEENDEYWNEFEFHGELYVNVEDMHPQPLHENYVTEPVGAVIELGGGHILIYSIENTMGITILTLERFSGVFVPEAEADNIIPYYENEAPLYAEMMDDELNTLGAVWNIDSDKVRQILDQVGSEGTRYPEDVYCIDDGDYDGYIFFYSEDDLICMDTQYAETKDGVVLYYRGYALLLDKEGSEFIMSIVDKAS